MPTTDDWDKAEEQKRRSERRDTLLVVLIGLVITLALYNADKIAALVSTFFGWR